MLHAVCVCLPRRLRRRHHYRPKWDFPHFMPEKKRRALHFPPTFVFPPLQPFLVPLKKEENCMFFSCPPLLFLLWRWHLSLLAPAAPPRNKDATTTQEISAKVEHVFFLEKQASLDSGVVRIL